jgi:hypothetical protein
MDLAGGRVLKDGLVAELLEAERVLHWRCEEFARLGFEQAALLMLTISEADLALARKLVAGGCPLGTAAAILL